MLRLEEKTRLVALCLASVSAEIDLKCLCELGLFRASTRPLAVCAN